MITPGWVRVGSRMEARRDDDEIRLRIVGETEENRLTVDAFRSLFSTYVGPPCDVIERLLASR